MAGAVALLAGTAVAAQPRETSGAERVHEVSRGDSLTSIARLYGVSVASLVTANRLVSARATLRPGQRLVVPGGAAPGAAAPGRAPAATKAPDSVVLAIPDFDDLTPPFFWPVEGAVTSPFGRRRTGWHRGIDIKAESGTLVQAAAPGIVIASGPEPRYGWVVKIEHDQGFVTVYAHHDENLVAVGDRVPAGELIATIGRTGRATSDHLHFEIRRNGRVYNPLYLLPLPPRVAQLEETSDAEEDHE
jgi:murein DD-endopeptidase MepM/ murein hydrolase activator NlpD